MPTNVTWNGVGYSIPNAGELNWASLTNFLVALGNNAAVAEEMKQAIRVATTTPVTVVAATDFAVVVDLAVAGASTVNLPAGVNGQVFVIVDGKGDASTNNITITPNGAETIGGTAGVILNKNRQVVMLQYQTATTDWKLLNYSLPIGGVTPSDLTGIIPADKGGTGVANNAAATLTRSGNHDLAITTTAATTVTMPTTGTLATLAGAETLTNKNLASSTNDVSGATALSFTNSGTITVPTGTDTLVARNTSDTMTNKTLASPIITTAATFNAEAELRLADADSSNYVGFKSPATVSSNQIWTLPSADGLSGQAITTTGAGVLQFSTISGGGSAAYSTPGSNVTLTSASSRKQVFLPSIPIDVTLPTTGIVAGDIFTITNLDALNAPITIKASGGAEVYYIDLCSGTVELVANQATPTLPAHWSLVTPVRSEVTTITPLTWNGAAWAFTSDFCTAQRNANILTIKTAGVVTSVGGGEVRAQLPIVGPSLTIDTTLIQDQNNNIAIGTLYRLTSAGPEYIYDTALVGAGNVMIADPDNPQFVYASQATQSYAFNKSIGSGLSSDNDYIEVEFTIPITQWKKLS